MLANPHFEGRIRSVGMEFIPLGEEKDFLSVLHDPRLAQEGKSPYLVIEALFNQSVEPSYRATLEAIRTFRPDVLLRHHILFAASWAAEQSRIPVVTGVLTPSMWFHPAEPMVLRSYLPYWIQKMLGRAFREGGRLALRWFIDRPVNRARARIGLPPSRDIFFKETRGGENVLGLWSPQFRPPMVGDPAGSKICGYCFFDRAGGASDASLDPDLDRFLSACEERGKLPIAFTLGTTIVHHAQDFFKFAVEACREIGRPAVLLVGRGENGPAVSGDRDIFVCPYAPHSLLMPRAAASVHHAGAGSSSQALRSGRPSVAVPFVNDEFDIAFRMRNLGVAVEVPASRMRSRKAVRILAEGLRQVVEGPTFPERARQLGEKIRTESGEKHAADCVEAAAGI